MRYCYTKSILQIDPAQPAPLKRIMKRVDQINRYDSQQSLTVDTVLLSTKQCSTHLCKGHQKKGDTHTHTHTHTRARAHTHTHTHTHTCTRVRTHMHTQNNSTSCSVFLFYFTENILLVADINHYYLDPVDKGLSTIPDAYKAEMFVPSNNSTNGTMFIRPTNKLLGNNGPVLHACLQQHEDMRHINTSFGSYTSHPTGT